MPYTLLAWMVHSSVLLRLVQAWCMVARRALSQSALVKPWSLPCEVYIYNINIIQNSVQFYPKTINLLLLIIVVIIIVLLSSSLLLLLPWCCRYGADITKGLKYFCSWKYLPSLHQVLLRHFGRSMNLLSPHELPFFIILGQLIMTTFCLSSHILSEIFSLIFSQPVFQDSKYFPFFSLVTFSLLLVSFHHPDPNDFHPHPGICACRFYVRSP